MNSKGHYPVPYFKIRKLATLVPNIKNLFSHFCADQSKQNLSQLGQNLKERKQKKLSNVFFKMATTVMGKVLI